MTNRRAVLFLDMTGTKQLHAEITKGNFKPVYYFYGSEDYRRVEAEKFVADHFLPSAQRSVNYHRIDSKKTSAAELHAKLANLPMLGEREVFVIGNFESIKPKEIEGLMPLIKSKDTNRVLILSTGSAKTPKKTSAFFKSVTEFAEPVEFKKMTSAETQSAIISRLSKNKISIENNALELLTGLLDGDKGGMEAELNKLIDFKSEGETVTIEDIKLITAGYEIFNIFELGDVIVQGKIQKIVRMLNSLVGSGTSIDFLMSLLGAHFISLYLVKNGRSPVGNRGFLIPKFRQQARSYSNQELESIIIALADSNAELRKQNLPNELVLETLTFNLAGQK